MDVKKEVFKTLSNTVRPDTILASNTSYLNINELASVVERPERMLGMHFFSPANVMRLLEVVRADKTSPDVLATILGLAKAINKVGAVAGVCHGFIGNRMLSGYASQANRLLLEGAAPHQLDKVLYDFGMPMGVIAMADLAGLDIGYRMRQALDETQYDVESAYLYDNLVEMGRLGQKTGAGVYDYEPGDRTAGMNDSRTAPSHSLVEVLPQEPVIPTTRARLRRRCSRAMPSSAANTPNAVRTEVTASSSSSGGGDGAEGRLIEDVAATLEKRLPAGRGVKTKTTRRVKELIS